MNKMQKGIYGQIQREKKKKNPDMKELRKLAKELVKHDDDEYEFLGNTNDKPVKEVRHGERCYKYSTWHKD